MASISKEIFFKSINSIKCTEHFQTRISNMINAINKNPEFSGNYCDLGAVMYPDCSSELLEILEELTNDTDGIIAYFCYCLNFGEHYHPGCIKDKYGEDINLATTEDLWAYLTMEDIT